MGLQKYWRILLAYRWLIVLVSLSALVTALLVASVLPERYTATAVVLLKPYHQVKLVESKDEKEILDYPVRSVGPVDAASKTYIQLIKSRPVVEEVVRVLDLAKKKRGTDDKEKPRRLGEHLSEAVDWARDMLKYGRVIHIDPFTGAVTKIQNGISLTPAKDTYIFEITNEDYDPQQAAAIANTLADVFVSYVIKTNAAEASASREFVGARLEGAERAVADAREALQAFKEKHGTLLLKEEYSSKLTLIAALEEHLEKSDARLSGLLEVHTESHPKVAMLRAERNRLVRSLQQVKRETANHPAKEHELENLSMRVKVSEEAYKLLNKEYEEARIHEGNTASELRIVSRAVAPSYPSRPIKLYFGLAGLLGGVVFSLFLAFLVEFQARRLRSIEDVREALDLPVLATIPLVKASPASERG